MNLTTTDGRYAVEKNGPREYAKESRRINRVYTGMITTWDVVDVPNCSLVSEHPTRREALAALAKLAELAEAPAPEKNPAAVALGRRGGQAKSAAKTAAARANAKRPRPRDLVLQMSAAGEGYAARLCMEGRATPDIAYYFAREAAHYAGLLLAAQARREVR